MSIKTVTLLALLSAVAFPTTAQTMLIGLVQDAETSEPLPFASIKLKNKPLGAYTDHEGKFKLKAFFGDSVVVSFVGYNSQIVILENNCTIKLIPHAKTLRQLVVTSKKSEAIICGIKVKNVIERGSWKVLPGYMMATKLELPDTVNEYYLNTVFLNMDGKLAKGEKLQLHVYDVTIENLSGKELLNEFVFIGRDYFLAKGVDVTKLNIRVNRAVFIGVETIGDVQEAKQVSAFPKMNFEQRDIPSTYQRKLQDSTYHWSPVIVENNYSEEYTLTMIVSVAVEKID
jgi:hypothetical protein